MIEPVVADLADVRVRQVAHRLACVEQVQPLPAGVRLLATLQKWRKYRCGRWSVDGHAYDSKLPGLRKLLIPAQAPFQVDPLVSGCQAGGKVHARMQKKWDRCDA